MNLFSNISLFPAASSTMAGRVDALFWALMGVSGFFILLIFTLIIVFSIKYRSGSQAERTLSTRGQLTLEIFWTALPAIIGLCFFIWGTRLYLEMVRVPKDALEVYVVGKQWMWKAQHAEGPREINELHVPMGRPIKLIMTSEDVIHSFFVPNFRTKRDVLPGRYESTWFEPARSGAYHLFCAEYCGDQHSRMRGRIVVMPPEDYRLWASAQHQEEPWMAGARIFRTHGCGECHRDQSTERGPALGGLYNSEVPLQDHRVVLADDNYLRESILNPNARIREGYPNLMPAYEGQFDAEQMVDLLIYLKSLRQLEVTAR